MNAPMLSLALFVAGGVTSNVVAQTVKPKTDPRVLRDGLSALARAGVPFALVLGSGDSLAMVAPRSAATELADHDDKDHESTEPPPKEEVIRQFVQRWDKLLTISDSGTILNITSPRARACLIGLEREIPKVALEGPLYRVFFEIGTTFDASLRNRPPRGLVGPGANSEGLTRELRIEVTAGPLRETLARVIESASGAGWVAQEHCRDTRGQGVSCGCPVGVMTAESLVADNWDACAGLDTGRAETP